MFLSLIHILNCLSSRKNVCLFPVDQTDSAVRIKRKPDLRLVVAAELKDHIQMCIRDRTHIIRKDAAHAVAIQRAEPAVAVPLVFSQNFL